MLSEPDNSGDNPGEAPSDEDLIKAYQRGDARALEVLVERFKRPLFSFVLRMTRCQAEAEEIFQETWLRVITKSSGFRSDHFKSWLFRIAHNLVIDWSRRERKLVSMDSSRGGDGNEFSLVDLMKSPDSGPDEAANNGDLRVAVGRAVARLPAELREVFILRTEADMAFKDIARLQRVSVNTALSRMQYALMGLRKMLKDYRPEIRQGESE